MDADFLILTSEPDNECGHDFISCKNWEEVQEQMGLLKRELLADKDSAAYHGGVDVDVCIVLSRELIHQQG